MASDLKEKERRTTTSEIKVENMLNNEWIFVTLRSHRIDTKYQSNCSSSSSNTEYSNQQQSASKSSSNSSTDDEITHNISTKSHIAAFGVSSNTKSNGKSEEKKDTELNECSNEYESVLDHHRTIDIGFVRIAPQQILPIPVIIENESQIVYISVYVEDIRSSQLICLAKELQNDREYIQIKRDENDRITIEPIQQYQDYKFYKLLSKWGIAEHLKQKMFEHGWIEPDHWNDLNEDKLMNMGFKDGHRTMFFNKYQEYKSKQDGLENSWDFIHLLKEWRLPIHLADKLKNEGWDDPELWHLIKDQDLKEMGFGKGHIAKFRKYVKKKSELKHDEHDLNDWKHIEQFRKIQEYYK